VKKEKYHSDILKKIHNNWSIKEKKRKWNSSDTSSATKTKSW
jgi:hypothetical protein